MIHDWWLAHKFEFVLDVLGMLTVVAIVSVMIWWANRMEKKP